MIAAAPPQVDSLREWLTLFIALAAVIVGPFIQARESKKDRAAHSQALKDELTAQRETTERQIFASVRSTNRQAWIDALRADVASYLNSSQRMAWLRGQGMSAHDGNELDKLMFEAGRTFTAIELRLNPNEESHIELMARLQALSSGIQAEPPSYNSLRDAVVEKAQSIFKFEWNRVKIGE